MSDLYEKTRDEVKKMAEDEFKINIGKTWGKQRIINEIEKAQGLEPSLPPPPPDNGPFEIEKALEPFIKRGLQIVELNNDYFHLRNENRECAGNTHQPIKQIVQQAQLLFKATKSPSES